MTTARCNPLWQPIPCPLSDIEGLESWLGDMAAQGLVPVTIGQNFARFRCSQPKAVRYRLNAKPAPETFLESAPGTPDGEERALAQECGWYYVTAVGDFFLYACEDSDAPELNTDPQVQALSLRYAKRQVFAPAGLLAYWLVTFWVRYAMGVWHTPVIDFEKCKHCMLCVPFCPDVAIPVKDGKRLDFDYLHCKGCGICVTVCPFDAITMKSRGEA